MHAALHACTSATCLRLLACQRCGFGRQLPSEQQNVRLRLMYVVVNPACSQDDEQWPGMQQHEALGTEVASTLHGHMRRDLQGLRCACSMLLS